MATIEEIKSILKYYDQEKSSLILLHCVSNYPCSIESVNLKSVSFLERNFNLPVGYSDHSSDNLVPILAIALKSKIIEKHFTLDKNMIGPDHRASSTPVELTSLIKEIRKSELILGEFSKNIQKEEYQMKKISRKSIYLNRSVLKFDIVSEDDFILQRPGLGINPLDINEILGKRYLRHLNKGELLNSKDIG
jgi:sialic acid synthase SpsE